MPSEAEIQSQIMAYLDSREDVYYWRNSTGSARIGSRFVKFGAPGSADLVGCLQGGRFLAIEVKAADGKQRPGQVAWQRRVERLGGLYVLARSVEDVRAALP